MEGFPQERIFLGDNSMKVVENMLVINEKYIYIKHPDENEGQIGPTDPLLRKLVDERIELDRNDKA